MRVPDDTWIFAPHLVFDARRVLASIRPFSAMVHSNAYSIPSVAFDLGARVRYRDDPSMRVIGMCTRLGETTVITLNGAVEGTEWDMAALVHELGHATAHETSLGCSGELRRIAERNAWLRGIFVAVSAPLAELVLSGRATFREIAGRCHVPEPLIRVRTALAITLGEAEGDVEWAYESIALNLLMVEQWFEEGRARRFREWATA